MTQKRALEHNNRAEDFPDHPDDSHQNSYSPTHADRDWTNDDKATAFMRELWLIDPNAASAIDHRENLTTYTEEGIEGMGATFLITILSLREEYPDQYKPLDGSAHAIAETVFQPMQQQIDDLAYKFARINEDPNRTPPEPLDYIIPQAVLYYRKAMLATELDNSVNHDFPDLAGVKVDHILHDRIEFPHSDHHEYQKNLFEWLKQNPGYLTYVIVDKITEPPTPWEQSTSQAGSYDFRGTSAATIHFEHFHKKQFHDAIQNDNFENFQGLLEHRPARTAWMHDAIQENAGFTSYETGEHIRAPAQFSDLDHAQEFIDLVKKNTQDHQVRSPESHDPSLHPEVEQHNFLDYIVKAFESNLNDIQQSQGDRLLRYLDDQDLYLSADAITYITRPRDEHFWKIADTADDTHTNYLTTYLMNNQVSDARAETNRLIREHHPDAFPINRAFETLAYQHRQNIDAAVAQGDHARYASSLDNLQDDRDRFVTAIREGTTFGAAPGYDVEIPVWSDRSTEFITSVKEQLGQFDLNDQAQANYHKATEHLLNQYAAHVQADVLQPDATSPGRQREMTELIRSIHFLLKPQN